MLRALSIRNVALIDSLDLEFDAGFTVFTGETGAGKSIVIESLALVLGGRGDSTLVGPHEDRCTVVAEFDDLPAAATALLAGLGIAPGECIVKRQLTREGRSRAFINGEPVAVGSLRALGETIADIHGQHAHHALLRRSVQRELLDAYAGNGKLLERLGALYAELGEVDDELAELGGDPKTLAAEVERLRFELEEFEQDDYSPAAIATLEQEQRRLGNMSALIAAVDRARERLGDGEQAAETLVASVLGSLREVEDSEPALAPVCAMLDEALINLGEAASALRQLGQDLELDPERLADLETRLARAHALGRKHRCSLADLGAIADALAARLETLADADDRRAALLARQASLLADYRSTADTLHAARSKAARKFAKETSEALQPLGMSGAQLTVRVDAQPSSPPSATGDDEVEFLFSGNAGMEPKPLARVASGGELSRASLAIQMAALGRSTLPTVVFDEVDVGIGGRVAAVIGQRLREFAGGTQVLCITHLPQVAALGQQHLHVSKAGEPARVAVTALDRPARTEELARMLGGLEITDSTRAHAEELLTD